MKIKINNSRKIVDIQSEFSGKFPYLKMVFFAKAPGMNQKLPKKPVTNVTATIEDCRRLDEDGEIELKHDTTVSDLETTLWFKYGLNVQVYRKSGGSWLETTATDWWTLEKQNKMGEDISNYTHREKPEEFDNDRVK